MCVAIIHNVLVLAKWLSRLTVVSRAASKAETRTADNKRCDHYVRILQERIRPSCNPPVTYAIPLKLWSWCH